MAFETAIAFWTNNEQPWKGSYSMLTSVTQVACKLPAAALTIVPGNKETCESRSRSNINRHCNDY